MDGIEKKIFTFVILIFLSVFFLIFITSVQHVGFFSPFLLFLIPFMAVFFWMNSICVRFRVKISNLRKNICQDNVDALLEMMDKWGNFTHILLRSNMIRYGIKSAMLRELFNFGIYPHRSINTQSKAKVYHHFQRLDIWNLKEVVVTPRTPYTTPVSQTGDGETHGKAGEENAWRTLQDLPNLGQFDVFYDVKIAGSQIDNVVVSKNGGVFLIEVKSWGGSYTTPPRNEDEKRKMVKVVSYDPSNPDMLKLSQQLNHHRGSFNYQFSQLQLLPDQVHDVLMISYPYNDTVRVVDRNSFPGSYSVLAVHEALDWLPKQTATPLTPEQRDQLVNYLSQHCAKKRTYCAVPSQPPVPTPQPVQPVPTTSHPVQPTAAPVESNAYFCPHCGNKLTCNSQFCGYCGQKI